MDDYYIVSPSQTSQALPQIKGRTYQWRYLGHDISRRRRVESILGKSSKLSIADDLDRIAHLLKQPFLDWMVQLGQLQKNSLNWWCSAIASKSPLQTNFFVLICFSQLVAYWCAKPSESAQIIVIEDPWLLVVLRSHNARLRNAQFLRSFDLSRILFRLSRYGRAVSIRVYFILFGLFRSYTARLYFWTKSMKPSPSPSVLIFSWIEDRSFFSDGSFRDFYTGRLAEILTKMGETVKRFTFPFLPWNPFKKIRKDSEDFIVSSTYASADDILISALHIFRLSLSVGNTNFQGWDYASLFQREILIENSHMEFVRFHLWYRITSKMAGRLRSIKTVIYPFENHPWEKVLCMAWRDSAPRVKLVGYQHSSIGSLLLNYFLGSAENAYSPLPDRIVANGDFGLQMLEKAGYTPQMLENGGALRYEHLYAISTSNQIKKPSEKLLPASVIAGFPSSMTASSALLEALLDIFSEGTSNPHFILKFHPDLPLDRIFKHALTLPTNFEISHRPLQELFNLSNIFLFVPPTTTWWEAYLSGLAVLKFRGDFLDIDPIENLSGRIHLCSQTNLRDVINERLRDTSTAFDSNGARQELLANVFSTVRNEVWAKVARHE